MDATSAIFAIASAIFGPASAHMNDLLEQHFQNYELPDHMRIHGHRLLDRVVDFESSSSQRIQFKTSGPAHLMERPYSCLECVYMLCKNDLHIAQRTPLAIICSETCLLYGGQTVNFRRRETNRRGIMNDADIKVCLGHDYSQYQKDCLEAAFIGYLLLNFGLRTTNVQAYPRFIYLNLPTTLDLDVVAGHEDLERVDSWNRGRRIVFVGTSPPQTTFDRPAYQGRLDEEVSPVTNLTTESESSPALTTVLNIATDDGDDEAEYEDDETPPFIDHHPRIVSERFRDMAQNLDLDALVHDDQALKDSIATLNRDVIVMLGSRPTMMFPHIQRRNFLIGVCPYIDIYFFDSNRCGLVLWWPDAANGRWLSESCNTLMKQIRRLSSMKLRLLIWRMQQHWPNTIGIPPEQAQSLREWLNDHPTSIQLDLMLRELSSMWNDSGSGQVDRVGQYLLYRMFDDSLPRVERQQRLLPLVPDDIADEMPELSMTQVMRNWSASRRSALVNETLGRVPNFNSLSQGQKAQALQESGKANRERLMQAWLTRFKTNGLFVEAQGETAQEEWQRFWVQMQLERMQLGLHEQSEMLTCCWCGQWVKKKVQGGTHINITRRLAGCPNGPKHTLGWEIVRGRYQEDVYPEANLFRLFFEWLPSPLVINQRQLASCFISFIEKNLWHPQAHVLHQKYADTFPKLKEFELLEEGKALGSTFMASVRKAMEKLAALEEDACDVQMMTRKVLAQEKIGRKKIKETLWVFAFGCVLPAQEHSETLIAMENFQYMAYGMHFGIGSGEGSTSRGV